MNIDQLSGPLRALMPLIAMALGTWLDDQTSGFIAAAIVFAISAAWSFWSNRTARMATQLSQVDGVQVVVGPTASDQLKKLASDPGMPGIVPANGGQR